MDGNVRVECPGCGTWLLVLPREVYGVIGQQFGLEGEVDYLQHVRQDTAATGDRLAVADAARVYTCPECSRAGQLPPSEELRRLAEEQGHSWPEP